MAFTFLANACSVIVMNGRLRYICDTEGGYYKDKFIAGTATRVTDEMSGNYNYLRYIGKVLA